MAKKMPPAGRPHRTPGASQPPRTSGALSGTVRERAGLDTLRTVYGDAWVGSDNHEASFPSDPQPKPKGGSGS
jgi:hypothetical protein